MKINHIITEFVTPQATAQDPGLEREKDVDVIFYGRMPQDFTADTAWAALEEVLPAEYPPGSERSQQKTAEVADHGGAVVTTKPLSIAQKLVKTFQAYGIKCRINAPGLEEDITRRGFLKGAGAAAAAAVGGTAMAQPIPVKVDKVDVQAGTITIDGEDYRLVMLKPESIRPRGGRWIAIPMAQLGYRSPGNFTATMIGDTVYVFPDAMYPMSEEDAGRRPVAPDPQNYDSDWDYYNDRDAEDPTEDDWYDDPEPNDNAWMGETKDKIGHMDADAFDDAISRLKKLAGAGPLRTVYDPNNRVYKNVPHAVQPAQQPKKAR
jgi:hypothetical protein